MRSPHTDRRARTKREQALLGLWLGARQLAQINERLGQIALRSSGSLVYGSPPIPSHRRHERAKGVPRTLKHTSLKGTRSFGIVVGGGGQRGCCIPFQLTTNRRERYETS